MGLTQNSLAEFSHAQLANETVNSCACRIHMHVSPERDEMLHVHKL